MRSVKYYGDTLARQTRVSVLFVCCAVVLVTLIVIYPSWWWLLLVIPASQVCGGFD